MCSKDISAILNLSHSLHAHITLKPTVFMCFIVRYYSKSYSDFFMY